ncbi:antitoxin [Nevskia soli]|uniref:antitoxin n=1 Tax=Nevskia soli TaxID=418856 RepID=UPI0012F73395|nr:AbrB/MazE/SpoVT family DNA-binding domain-containing protein [Nevskia soli]
MTTVKLLQLGKSQVLRIPARYRMNAQEVEVFQRDGELVLRPKPRTVADLFAQARSLADDMSDWERPEQGKVRQPKETLP